MDKISGSSLSLLPEFQTQAEAFGASAVLTVCVLCRFNFFAFSEYACACRKTNEDLLLSFTLEKVVELNLVLEENNSFIISVSRPSSE